MRISGYVLLQGCVISRHLLLGDGGNMAGAPTLEEHLFAADTKRILSLDGGGVRGIITIAFLERIEAVLKERSGRGADFRLSDYFDLVGGTSVGSILATLIALGYPVTDIKKIFREWCPSIFHRPWLRHSVHLRRGSPPAALREERERSCKTQRWRRRPSRPVSLSSPSASILVAPGCSDQQPERQILEEPRRSLLPRQPPLSC